MADNMRFNRLLGDHRRHIRLKFRRQGGWLTISSTLALAAACGQQEQAYEQQAKPFCLFHHATILSKGGYPPNRLSKTASSSAISEGVIPHME